MLGWDRELKEPTQMSNFLPVHLAQGTAYSMHLRPGLTKSATIQAHTNGFGLDHSNIYPTYELLEFISPEEQKPQDFHNTGQQQNI